MLLVAVHIVGAAPPPVRGCGLNSVLVLGRALGQAASAAAGGGELAQRAAGPRLSLADLAEMACLLGVVADPVQGTWDELVALDRPLVLHLAQPDHFVCLLGQSATAAQIQEDPDQPLQVVPLADLQRRSDGHALVPRASPEAERPVARVPEADFDFGIGVEGQRVEHDYRIVNAGTQPLKLKVGGTSCSCTAALLGTAEVPPGGSTTVKLRLTVQTVGRTQQQAVVGTNDPLRPFIYLTLRGQPSRAVRLSPPALKIHVPKRAGVTERLYLVGPPGLRVTQVDVDAPEAEVAVEHFEVDAQRASYRLAVVVPPGDVPGTRQARVTLRTNAEGHEALVVPLAVTTIGNASVEPAVLLSAPVRVGDVVRREFVVRSVGKPLVAVRVARPNHPRLHCGPPERQADGSYRLVATLHTREPGLIDGAIVIEADADGWETLTVPVLCEVRPAGG